MLLAVPTCSHDYILFYDDVYLVAVYFSFMKVTVFLKPFLFQMGKRNKKPNSRKEDTEIIGTKKPKNDILLDTNDDKTNNLEINVVRKSKKTKKPKIEMGIVSKNNNNSSVSKDNTATSNKILFGDDGEPQEVPATSGATNTSKKKKNKKFLNDDEADVKEEDIDKFCDELEEEDNVQYENWVKLIEDKLHSKKIKSE